MPHRGAACTRGEDEEAEATLRTNKARLGEDHLAEYRCASSEKEALESGAVRVPWEDATAFFVRWNALNARLMRDYDLDPEVNHFISPVTGEIWTED